MRAPVPKRWQYFVPLLVLLMFVAAAAYVINQAAAASALPGKTGPQQVAGLSMAGGVDATSLQPGETQQLPNGVIVGRDLQHDVSPPLRDIPPVAFSTKHEAPENPYPFRAPTDHGTDSVVQRSFGALAMPTPSLTFEGISAAQSACGCLPPDTNGDVGPNHYVQTVNSAFAVWDKSGNVLLTPRNINTLWSGFGGACQVQNAGDPVVLYDPLADRWLISQFTSATPFEQCVAVSTSPDPTGSYNRYAFLESATLLYDYPKMGVWPDAYYLGANRFDAQNNYHGAAVLAFDRTSMLAGQSATFQEFDPGNFYYTVLPADLDGATPPPAGAPNPFVSVSGNRTLIHLWRFHVDWTTPANSTFAGPINLQAAEWDPNLCGGSQNCIPQPGTSVRLDSLFDHAMYRLAYRNFGDHESLVTNESVNVGGNQAGVRWYELRDPNGNPVVYQQGTYAPDAANRWMGSAAQDRDGNIAVGYSVSSSSIFPGIRYAGRLATDPLGQLAQGEATLFDGVGSQTDPSHRWGDYSMMAVDPSDDCTFWYTNEYNQGGGANWRTRIGTFKFPSCGQTTPSPTPTGTPPTNTPVPTATSTPLPLPTVCSVYTVITGTASIVPGTTDIGNHCDDCSTPLTLPFPVQIYDQSFTQGYVTSNGVLEFGSSDYAYANECLPVPVFNYAIAAFWDDLVDSQAGQGIFTSTTGTAPNRIFNIEWRATSYASNASENFEIRLYETPPGGAGSQFDIVYGTVTDVGSSTVGVQRTGGPATTYECNTPSLLTGQMLTFTLPPCPTATPTTVPSNTPVAATATATPGAATATPCAISFSDVHATDYFYEPVRYLYCHGVISGYGDGTFRPYNNTTRAQMVKIVVLGFGIPVQTPTGGAYTFHDVAPGAPFFDVIETAAAHNIVSGYNCGPGGPGPCDPQNRPYFLPNNTVTRGQLSKIDAVAAGWTLLNPPTATFTDVPPSSTFYTYIETAVCHGVISGYADHTFHPFAEATRGQISKIVYLSITEGPGTCAVTPVR